MSEVDGTEPFIGTDPASRKLGSGGGTLNLLVASWRKSRTRQGLFTWLKSGQRLVLHSGGESRRLPGYAAQGKAFLPIPTLPGLTPRRFDQMLVDFQIPTYQQVLREAGPSSLLMVASGDVWLDFDALQIPAISADISGIGMRVSPDVAQHFGVFFIARANQQKAEERPISFFLQKPSVQEIYRHSEHYDFYVDTGMWLFSAAAIELLFRRCGWSEQEGRFLTADGFPDHLDLYTEIGIALGTQSRPPANLARLGWKSLTHSVIPLDHARFYHVGSSRQLFESMEQLQQGELTHRKAFRVATNNASFRSTSSLPVWLDSVSTAPAIELNGHNIVSGLNDATRVYRLAAQQCLEVAPIGAKKFVVRPYHLDDDFRGSPKTTARICGQPADSWLQTRGLSSQQDDIFDTPLYPVLTAEEISQELIDWFFSSAPSPEISLSISKMPLLSARELPRSVNFARLFAQRRDGYAAALKSEFETCLASGDSRVFEQDFAAIAAFAATLPSFKRWLLARADGLLKQTRRPEHRSRLLLLFSELTGGLKRRAWADEGYRQLRSSIISATQLGRVNPSLALKEDQIVWARSPVRLDLAGGWTDTPPYCLENGGSVLNMAVLLNGQPPIQVFIRPLSEPRFRLKSIDLGTTEDVTTYASLSSYQDPRASFSLPKAALTLAGFHPDYLSSTRPSSLSAQLKAFGSGLEISLLSAVPKGSGLGTSSILGAALLGALNRACGLGWDELDLYHRVLGVEQLLTTGGGWQDQAGALFRSVKLVQTQPGASQIPTVRYLPEHLLGGEYANHTILLYYTGATRLAKGILKEIVHDMFLGRSATSRTLSLIRSNADQLYHALQGGSPETLRRCIGRSWELNKRLDSGTTTPEIEQIIRLCGTDLDACKLLGAGGGGYMLILAKNAESGR